jgi:hypothetical protein
MNLSYFSLDVIILSVLGMVLILFSKPLSKLFCSFRDWFLNKYSEVDELEKSFGLNIDVSDVQKVFIVSGIALLLIPIFIRFFDMLMK